MSRGYIPSAAVLGLSLPAEWRQEERDYLLCLICKCSHDASYLFVGIFLQTCPVAIPLVLPLLDFTLPASCYVGPSACLIADLVQSAHQCHVHTESPEEHRGHRSQIQKRNKNKKGQKTPKQEERNTTKGKENMEQEDKEHRREGKKEEMEQRWEESGLTSCTGSSAPRSPLATIAPSAASRMSLR